MLKRIVSFCIIFLIILVLTPASFCVPDTSAKDLPVPQVLKISREGTDIILDWQNPQSVIALAASSYKNYKGEVDYIIDWRTNGGAWHYSKEIPSGKSILDCYDNIPLQFCGSVYDSSGSIASHVVINKVLFNIPYASEVSGWLKSNNLELRIRYVYNYWDDNTGEMANQNSLFSTSALIGAVKARGNPSSPNIAPNQYLKAPSEIEAPKGLVSEYMKLGLNWQVPESVRTLEDQQLYTVYAVIDWKLNNGKWNDGLGIFRGKRDVSLIRDQSDLSMDMDGYIHTFLDRSALGIPDNISLRVWLASRTYSFRVRYLLQSPGENGVKEVLSSYSNTVLLGRGTTAPEAPRLTAPSGLKAKVSNEYGRKKISFAWNVPSGVLKVNKKLRVTTYLDYKTKGGKWLTENGGKGAAEGTTGDLRETFYKTLSAGKTKGVTSYRVFFAVEYRPDTYVYSGFSNVITVDIGMAQ